MYNTGDIESKWKKHWQDTQVYKITNDSTKPKYYVLDMFPYPSGSGLHVGHPLGYVASDIFSRFKRMKGFNVLHPMGYDAFGLPAEQYAITTGVHPDISTNKNIEMYRSQLDNLGFSFDWSREVRTSDPSYYKWTQWIFLKLYAHYYDTALDKAVAIDDLVKVFEQNGNAEVEAATAQSEIFTATEWKAMSPKEQDDILMNYRLAYRTETFVNWCEALGTVLSNDEVKDGVSERGAHAVERKPMVQWSLRTTAYAERLLSNLDELDWSDAMKKMQRNWIGRSEGAQMFFQLEQGEGSIEVFTTRPDTIFGATFMVLAPEHDLVKEITTAEQQSDIDQYLDYVKTRSERDRMSDVKTVTGAFTGAYAINPFTETKIPVWISEYVLTDYGTGAIMAVPSDDDRDNAFADKFGLEIIDVIDKSKYPGAGRHDKLGIMINSGFLTGMEVPDAINAALEAIDERKLGKRMVNYKLRDAGYGRQRYWGEPIPVVFDENDIAHPLSEDELPLELPPMDDFKPASGGESPLARNKEWTILENGNTRETDTMPGFAGSSWYFLRYMDPHNDTAFASREAIDYWQDVDLYIGGTEHATGHLLYSRMWNNFLYDLGYVAKKEPFKKLVNQGMIQGVIEYTYYHKEKGVFISADLIDQYDEGSLAEMFVRVEFLENYGIPDSPSYLTAEGIAKFKEWRKDFAHTEFITSADGKFYTHSEIGKMSKSKYNTINPDEVVAQYGADVFRMYEMFLGPLTQGKPWNTKGIDGVSRFLRKLWNLVFDENDQLILTDDAPTEEEWKILHKTIKKVSEDIERLSFNTCVSAFMEAVNNLSKSKCHKRAIIDPLVRLLAPFAPFIADEIWEKLGNNESIHLTDYPEFDASKLVESTKTYPIAINGKTRATIQLPADMSKDDAEKAALEAEEIQKWLEGKTIRKVIVVPGRMINIVVG